MSDARNLDIWNRLTKTDPDHVKPITGKSYKGSSPKPHYIIKRLTEEFGPVGKGFGWRVLSAQYIDGKPHADGTEKLHECLIAFWWSAEGQRHEFEAYGGTKALYKTKGDNGYWVDDEDAAKKSLTDAITKAASQLGVAADIFMGQWDDSKYVHGLQEEKAKTAREEKEAKHEANVAALIGEIESAETLADLKTTWTNAAGTDAVKDKRAAEAKDKRKAELDAAPQLDDEIPY